MRHGWSYLGVSFADPPNWRSPSAKQRELEPPIWSEAGFQEPSRPTDRRAWRRQLGEESGRIGCVIGSPQQNPRVTLNLLVLSGESTGCLGMNRFGDLKGNHKGWLGGSFPSQLSNSKQMPTLNPPSTCKPTLSRP